MTAIQGPSVLGPQGYLWAQAWAASKGADPVYIDNAKRYWAWAPVIGLRPEVMFAHHAKETKYGKFGGVLTAEWHNPAGIKLAGPQGDYDPEGHERFPDWETGVIAHINHVGAYVYGRDFTPIGNPHSRLPMVQSTAWAGTVRNVEQYDGRWAPSPTYGRDLVRLYLNPLLHFGFSGAAAFTASA